MEDKKLPKHLQAAVNQLQKHVDKYDLKIAGLLGKKSAIELEVNQLAGHRQYFEEQIRKLLGGD